MATQHDGTGGLPLANHAPERPYFATDKNSRYKVLTTYIINDLQRPFLKNHAELTTLNDVGLAAFC